MEDISCPSDEHATHVYHHHPLHPGRYLVEGVPHLHEQGGHIEPTPEYLGVKPSGDDHRLDPMDVAREESAATTVYRDKDNNPRYTDCKPAFLPINMFHASNNFHWIIKSV